MRRDLGIGLMALLAALAPAPAARQDAPQPPPKDLAVVRAEAGVKAFELTWLYYSENRIDMEKVYWSSRRLLEAQRDAAADAPARSLACAGHLERMGRL